MPSVKVLYFAATGPTDSKLQVEVRLISKETVEKNKFAVGVFFWNYILEELANTNHHFIGQAH